MAEPTVWTFFYVPFMNLDVLRQGGFEVKRLITPEILVETEADAVVQP
jgi:hypothetical protein